MKEFSYVENALVVAQPTETPEFDGYKMSFSRNQITDTTPGDMVWDSTTDSVTIGYVLANVRTAGNYFAVWRESQFIHLTRVVLAGFTCPPYDSMIPDLFENDFETPHFKLDTIGMTVIYELPRYYKCLHYFAPAEFKFFISGSEADTDFLSMNAESNDTAMQLHLD